VSARAGGTEERGEGKRGAPAHRCRHPHAHARARLPPLPPLPPCALSPRRYGRLGHGLPANDELKPRVVKTFEPERLRVASIAAGNAITFFTTRAGTTLYYCGITKKSGEAATTPRYLQDLAGWSVRAVASGATSSIVAAEASVVSFGPSPTCGELGYGEAVKSSTKPKLVDTLEGCHALDVAMGLGASMVVVDTSSGTPAAERARKAMADGTIPTYTPVEPAPDAGAKAKGEMAAAAAAAAAAAGGKKKK
jgi:hypothetical protein